MTTEWPPPEDAESRHLLNNVDLHQMPNAKKFSACLEALASSPNVYAWIPCIGTLNGVTYEMHNNGVPGRDYYPSSVLVATPDDYQNGLGTPEYVSTVLEHIGATPEHFMAFAQVLSGQHLEMGAGGTGEESYVTPVDWAYGNLAFAEGIDTGSASGDVKEAVADFAALSSAQQAIAEAAWEGTGKEAAMTKFVYLMNFLIHLRGPIYAEFGATLVAYVALVKAARERLNELMGQADAAMRGLEADGDFNPLKALAILLTLAGFIPAMPYAVSFGIGVASAAVSHIESKAKQKEAPEELLIPEDQRQSCVDILSWYLDEARATCEGLSDGVAKLTARLPVLLDEVMNSLPEDVHVPDELRWLPT